MKEVTLYHHPRCSKSRATLALLRSRGIEPEIVDYMKNPPDANDLARILGMLEMAPKDLLRKGEPAYLSLGLAGIVDDSGEVIRQMIANPILIERPIVVVGNQARIGRPPEKVLEIL
ncbi:MAG: arsenate reductase (glutaredoxin) [bacterium]|nr:arsenate reductase (glutaredoxin) [bacterium]